MVRTERLELSRLAAPEPKSGVSTNSTTSACYSNFRLVQGFEYLSESSLIGGYAEIRTLGAVTPDGFQDRCLKPLGHVPR